MITGLHYFIAFLSPFLIVHSANKKAVKHPTYVSVVQIDFNSEDKFATLLCKTFTDDLVRALQKQFSKRESIADPADRKKLSAEMDGYIKSHVQIKINDRPVKFSFTDYKEDKEINSVGMYFRINDIDNINKFEINDTIFYELYDSQIQIIYVTVNGNRKSNKLRNPASTVSFDF